MARTEEARATLRQVAREAGVSISTVSRVVRGEEYVQEETRERVAAAMRKLNYQPSRVARSLKMGSERTGNICLLINEPGRRVSEPFFTEFLAGVTDAAIEDAYDVLISTRYSEASPDDALRWILSSPLSDGVVFVGRVLTRRLSEQFTRHRMPLVVFGYGKAEDPDCLQVGPDDYGGMRMVTEHIIAHGHRRVAFIAAAPQWPTTQDRLQGYQDAMTAHGLKIDSALIRHGEYSIEFGYQQTLELFADPDRAPTAVLGASDLIAFGVIQALSELGLRVPEDVAVTGFDDIAQAQWCQPPLTTVRQPMRDEGYMLARRLLDIIAGKEAAPSFLVPVQLITRRSCGCG